MSAIVTLVKRLELDTDAAAAAVGRHDASCADCYDAGSTSERCAEGQGLEGELDTLLRERQDVVSAVNAAEAKVDEWCFHTTQWQVSEES